MNDSSVIQLIGNKITSISQILMNHETKNFCLAKISPYNWHVVSYQNIDTDTTFVIVPSPAFKRFILDRQYLSVVSSYSSLFGTGNDWNIVRAIKSHEHKYLLRDYSDEEFFDYIKGETMAYVFKIENDNTINERILRLDLCRGINRDNVFQGGIFHVFKHFTVEGYDTISSWNQEYVVNSFPEIYKYVILNFFSDDYKEDRKTNYYEALSTLADGHLLRGIYYQEDNIPVAFITSMRISQG
jgi:hypothetical protein